ncbi:MAG: hypothetical protein DHS20C12_18640 [Pseudohongiella sp.]|nr:MAG: hypothetical protein DHS20C12_18640 [Pseudohongiella sp.]
MIEQLLLITGATILGVLGSMHLLYTFASKKFDARDEAVTEAMKNASPVITRETTMWNAWIGFNASHSLGAILITAFYVPLALSHMQLIRESLWFSILPVLIGLSYLVLAKNYWFKIPFIGIAISTACFITAAVLINS